MNFTFCPHEPQMHSKSKLIEVDLGQKFSKFNILLWFFFIKKIELNILLRFVIQNSQTKGKKNTKSIINVSVFRIFWRSSYQHINKGPDFPLHDIQLLLVMRLIVWAKKLKKILRNNQRVTRKVSRFLEGKNSENVANPALSLTFILSPHYCDT